MESEKHYFFVGSFVLTTAVVALLFAVWITSKGQGEFIKYYIRFAESVSGLGVSVGAVETISIDKYDSNLIYVTVRVDRNAPIKIDTEASLKLQGVTGVIFIELSGGNNESENLADISEREDKMQEIKAKSSPLSAIVDRMPELLDRISNGVEQFNKMVSDENIGSLNNILTDLNEMTSTSKSNVKDAVENLNHASQQLDSLLRNLKKTSSHISNITESLDDDPSRLIFPTKNKGVTAP
jgi:phospholipid/cholesterol/gamma-HCH transport system substrate-binding protein